MLEYDFYTLSTAYGTGYNPFAGGIRIDTEGHREVILDKAREGWRYVGFIPKRQRAGGYMETIDLVFERQCPET